MDDLYGALIAMAIGAVFLIVSLIFVIPASRPFRGGITTTGRVVDVAERSNKNGSLMYAAVVEFSAYDGRTHRVESNLTRNTRPRMGVEKKVSYRRDQPEQARVITTGALWLGLSFALIGLAAAVAGVAGIATAL